MLKSFFYKLHIKPSLLSVLAGCYLSLLAQNLSAKLVLYTFEEKVQKSDIIICGQVKKVKKSIFAKNKSLIDVNYIVVGQLETKQIEIRYGRESIFFANEDTTTFEVGREYILFLRKENNFFNIVGANQGYYLIGKDGTVCLDQQFIKVQQFINKIHEIKRKNEVKP